MASQPHATVEAALNYIAPMDQRPRYYANDHSRDILSLDSRVVPITDGRESLPSLDVEGFQLVPHHSGVADFRDAAASAALYPREIEALLGELTGADQVIVTSPGILRFAEKSSECGEYDNSHPARFIHVDIDDDTAAAFATRSAPAGKTIARYAHYNIWRVISPPPQDVPLGLCDARSIRPEDMVQAEAVFDAPGKPEWSFISFVMKPAAHHRWHWFRDMTPDEAIVFKTNDSDPTAPHCVPHSAFDSPDCPADAVPRASVEIRAIAYWFE